MLNVLFSLPQSLGVMSSILVHKLVEYWRPLAQMQSDYIYVPVEKEQDRK